MQSKKLHDIQRPRQTKTNVEPTRLCSHNGICNRPLKEPSNKAACNIIPFSRIAVNSQVQPKQTLPLQFLFKRSFAQQTNVQERYSSEGKKSRFTELSFFFFFYWFALRCIPSAPARQIRPEPTQSAALHFCRVGDDSAYSSYKSQHYPGISCKQRRGCEPGGGVSGLARESRLAKNNSIVRERTTNTAAGSHTLTSTHYMAAWL